MAKVALGDLLNPLKKMEEFGEKTANQLEVVVQITANGLSIQQQILTELKVQTQALQAMMGSNASIGKALTESGGGGGGKGPNAGTLKDLGLGTIQMAKGLLLFALVPKKVVNKFLDFIVNLGEKLADMDTKKMEEGAKALKDMGNAVWGFSWKLVLAAILIIPALILSPLIIIAIGLYTLVFMVLGRYESQIDDGAWALQQMGWALIIFGIGLAIFALSALIILANPASLLVMVASVLLMGLAIAIIGLFDKQIRKGAVAMIFMGIGLAFFSVGIFLFALVAMMLTLESVLVMVGTLIGVGIAVAIVGALAAYLIPGAIAMIVMGIGLAAFAIGILLFRLVTMNMTLEDIAIMAGTIVAIGLAFLPVGLISPFIYLAAPALLIAGLALMSLAGGVLLFYAMWKKTKVLFEPSPGGETGFFGGKLTNMEVALNSIAWAVAINPIAAAGIYLGAPALLLAGLALMSLAGGVVLFGKAYKSAEKNGLFDPTGETGWFGGEILVFEKVLDSIAAGLSINPFTVIGIMLGAPALLAGGIALMALSGGVVLFGKAYASAKANGLFNVSENNDDILVFEEVLDSIAAGISINPFTVMGIMLGAPALILGAGALLLLYPAIKLWGKLAGDANVQLLFAPHETYKITSFWGGTREASNFEFMMHGVAAAFDLPLLVTANMYATAPALIMAGVALQKIATGISMFEKIISKVKGGDLSAITENIVAVVTTVSQAFGQIGGDNSSTSLGGKMAQMLGFGGDIPGAIGPDGTQMYSPDAVKRGIESVSGMGDILTSVAKGVLAFASMRFTNADGEEILLSGEVQAKAIQNAEAVISTVAVAFGNIGKTYPVKDDGWFSSGSSDVQMGIQAVSGMGDILTSVAAGVKAFADMTFKDADGNMVTIDPADLMPEGKIIKNIENVLGAVAGVFGTIGAMTADGYFTTGNSPYSAEDVKTGVDAVKGIGGILSGVADAVKAFAENPGIDTEKIKSFLMGIVEAVADMAFEDPAAIETGAEYIGNIFDSLALTADFKDPLKEVAETIEKMKTSINAMNLEKLAATSELIHNLNVLGESGGDTALEAVAESLQGIMETMAEAAAPAAEEGGGADLDTGTESTPDNPQAAVLSELKKINGSIGGLQGVLNGLPDDIANIKLKVNVD